MVEHVLIPYDDSEQSRTALEHALSQYPETRLTVLYVVDPSAAAFDAPMTAGPVAAEDWYEDAEADAEQRLAAAASLAEAQGRQVETEHTVGRPADAVVEYADDHDVDGIVMGSHGRSGLSRVLLGSVAETVVRRAPCPVTVVR